MSLEFNKQGRRVSDSMRLKYFLTATAGMKRPPIQRFEYRGFEISGRAGQWFKKEIASGGSDPRIFTSRAKAISAADACLAVRLELV